VKENVINNFQSKLSSFFHNSAWLINAVLTSLSFSLLNPWNTLSRIAAYFPVVFFIQQNANMALGLQVSFLLSIANGIHLIVREYFL
jgi:hypothetical protein